MDWQTSPKTPKSASIEPSTPKAPSKSSHSRESSSSVRILGSLEIAALSPSPPASQGRQPQTGQPRGGRPASPRGWASPGSVESAAQGLGAGDLVHSRTRSPVRPTIGVLSPRKVVTKHVGTSSAGHVAQVAASKRCRSTRQRTPHSTLLPVLALHATA